MIENKSAKYLFLQEGDRMQGGKQDADHHHQPGGPTQKRQDAAADLLLRAEPLAAWSGKDFKNTANAILAPVSLRATAKGTAGEGGTAECGRGR